MKNLIKPLYQPIVDIQSNRITHFEALARLRTEQNGSGHGTLIEAAEKHGFIHLIDLSMTEQVLRAAQDHTFSFAVNMSPDTISTHAAELCKLFGSNKSILPRMTVEITETTPCKNIPVITNFVGMLRDFGGKLALDDYGNSGGHFTEEIVKLLRPDFLKLDGTVLDRAEFFNGISELIRLRELADAIDAELIAEFVDSTSKVDLLKSVQIKYAQGFLFGRAAELPILNPSEFGLTHRAPLQNAVCF